MAATLCVPIMRARPTVWTTHGLHALRRGMPGVARGTRAAMAASAVTLCCSQAERDELGGGTVVPNGVDPVAPVTDEQRAVARAELGVEGRVALFLGELDERKDPLTAARAAQQAGVTLLVAGDGPLRAALETMPGVPRPRLPPRRRDAAARGRHLCPAVAARGHRLRGARGDGARAGDGGQRRAGQPRGGGRRRRDRARGRRRGLRAGAPAGPRGARARRPRARAARGLPRRPPARRRPRRLPPALGRAGGAGPA